MEENKKVNQGLEKFTNEQNQYVHKKGDVSYIHVVHSGIGTGLEYKIITIMRTNSLQKTKKRIDANLTFDQNQKDAGRKVQIIT